MKIRNLTPQVLNILNDYGATVVVEESGQVARCKQIEKFVGILPGAIEVTRQVVKVEGLPAAEPGTILVVSRMVAELCKDRTDVYVPGPLVRDEEGRIVGCRGLSALYD